MIPANEYRAVMRKREEIMRASVGIDYAKYERGALAFDYEQRDVDVVVNNQPYCRHRMRRRRARLRILCFNSTEMYTKLSLMEFGYAPLAAQYFFGSQRIFKKSIKCDKRALQ